MDYGKFKQGTIIHKLRSEQYPNRECSAIIITAECDIAQCKVSKFYYLTAMDVRTWIETEGYDYTVEMRQLNMLRSLIANFGDKIPGLKEYQNAAIVCLDDVETILNSWPSKDAAQTPLKELSKIKGLKVEKKAVIQKLKDIIDDNLIQYFFLPRNTYMVKGKVKSEDAYEGLVVNLQNIGYFDAPTVAMIQRQDMDFEKLSPEDLELYGKMFFLEKQDDIIFPEENIRPPYRERLMQAFSHAFIRIGVKFDKKAAKDYWDKILLEPKQ